MTAQDNKPEPAPKNPKIRLGVLLLILVVLGGILGFRMIQWGRARFHFGRAEQALVDYDFGGARRELAILLTIDPENAAGWLLAAQASRREGDLDEAKKASRKYRAIAGITPEGRLEESLQDVQLGNIEENVQDLLAKADAGHPATEQIFEALTVGSVQVYFFDRAVFWLNYLLGQYPKNPIGRLTRARIDTVLGKRERAMEMLQGLLQDFPGNVKAKLLLAGLYFSSQDFVRAAQEYGELHKADPENTSAALGLIRSQVRLGKTEEAKELAKVLEDKFSSSSDALMEAGRFALGENRVADAERLLRKAQEISPNDPELLYQLGNCLRIAGKGDESKKFLDRFKEVEADGVRLDQLVQEVVNNSKDPAPRREAARICFRNGQKEEGLRWLHGALGIAPNDRGTHSALADYYAGTGDKSLADFHRQKANAGLAP